MVSCRVFFDFHFLALKIVYIFNSYNVYNFLGNATINYYIIFPLTNSPGTNGG